MACSSRSTQLLGASRTLRSQWRAFVRSIRRCVSPICRTPFQSSDRNISLSGSMHLEKPDCQSNVCYSTDFVTVVCHIAANMLAPFIAYDGYPPLRAVRGDRLVILDRRVTTYCSRTNPGTKRDISGRSVHPLLAFGPGRSRLQGRAKGRPPLRREACRQFK